MLLFRSKTIYSGIEYINLKFELCIVFLSILHFVTEHVTLILDSLHVNFIFTDFATFYHQFTFKRVNLFFVLSNLSLMLCTDSL